ncbi:MAG: type 4a pilus biogenesis protein PilO [Proteobacteria bacterium]|nr:type 4a pilus biogenesis protein PilO [Pseudomonadota bacterium]
MKKIELTSKTFEPMFKKIEELDKIQRLFICVFTIALLGAAFFFLSAKPTLDKIAQYRSEYESTEKKLNVAKRKAAQLVQLQNERKMKEAEFRKVMKALPEKKEIPSLLTSISQSGQDTGMEFQSFEPKKEVNQGFYGEIPVDISMLGDYHNTIMFIDKVTSLNRIVNIKNIQMASSPSKDGGKMKIKTLCQAVTYKFVEQQEAVPSKDKKTKKKR